MQWQLEASKVPLLPELEVGSFLGAEFGLDSTVLLTFVLSKSDLIRYFWYGESVVGALLSLTLSKPETESSGLITGVLVELVVLLLAMDTGESRLEPAMIPARASAISLRARSRKARCRSSCS